MKLKLLAFLLLLFSASGAAEEFSMDVENEWDMISVPAEVEASELRDQCEFEEENDLLGYDSSEAQYYEPETLYPFEGYWAKTSGDSDCEFEYEAEETSVSGGEFSGGWNMISTSSVDTLTLDMLDEQCELENSIFTWNTDSGEYDIFSDSLTLDANTGYWIQLEDSCEIELESSAPEAPQEQDAFFELERTEEPGTYSAVSNSESINILDGELTFSSRAESDSFSYETESGEESLTLVSPDFDLSIDTGSDRPMVSTGDTIEASISNYDDNQDEEYGQGVADKSFFVEGGDADLEQQSTDGEGSGFRGYEEAGVTLSDPGIYSVGASVTDTTPGVGITYNATQQVWVGDGLVRDYVTSGYLDDFEEQDVIAEDWNIYYGGEQTDSWNDDGTVKIDYSVGEEYLIMNSNSGGTNHADLLTVNRNLDVEGDFRVLVKMKSESEDNKMVFWNSGEETEVYDIKTDNDVTTFVEENLYVFEYVDGELSKEVSYNHHGDIFGERVGAGSRDIGSIDAIGFETSGDDSLMVDYIGIQSIN